MRLLPALLAAALLVACAGAPARIPADQGAMRPMSGALPEPDSGAVLHLLNRLTFGPRPGDIGRVQALSMNAWLEAQLAPGSSAEPAEATVRARWPLAFLPPAESYRRLPPPNVARRMASRADSMAPDSLEQVRFIQQQRRMGGHLAMATLTRHVLAERQLLEVMTDFWFNHFNVFQGKQLVRWTVADYVERAIRPNALGRFEDLLIATATHPAMLVYLDNAQSVAPGSQPPGLARTRPGMRRRLTEEQRARLAQAQARMPTGINENYARELLELHTLGVDGGYTQADVQAVARILTGWSVRPPGPAVGAGANRGEPLSFEFRAWAHDNSPKTVLGVSFPAMGGEREGRRLLEMLAAHPATARHISHKLCARLVADEAPDGCVDAAVSAWRRSGGEIGAVIRAIVHGADFWAPAARGAKIRSPLEFLVAALRATGAQPDSSPGLAGLLGRLGQPLFGNQVPTGYPETREDWVNSGALLNRMNVAVALASGRTAGVTSGLDSVVPLDADLDRLVRHVNEQILAGRGSATTLRVIREQVADTRDPRQARALAVGLALGSPDFQRQ